VGGSDEDDGDANDNAIMPNLKKLTLTEWFIHYYADDDSPFLKKNAKTLVKLDLKGDIAHDDSNKFKAGDSVFEKLKEIRICDFTFTEACPIINSVTVWGQESRSIFQLPVEHVTELRIRSYFKEEEEAELISRLVNLKHLKYITGSVDDDKYLIQMLEKMTQLESLFIGIEGAFKGKHLMQWTKTLYENNKKLSSFVFETKQWFEFDNVPFEL
jgi:hypothetical protein